MSKSIRAINSLMDETGLVAPGTVIDYYDVETATKLVKDGHAEWAKGAPAQQYEGDPAAIIELMVKKGRISKDHAEKIQEMWGIVKVDDIFALSVPEICQVKGILPDVAEDLLKRLKK